MLFSKKYLPIGFLILFNLLFFGSRSGWAIQNTTKTPQVVIEFLDQNPEVFTFRGMPAFWLLGTQIHSSEGPQLRYYEPLEKGRSLIVSSVRTKLTRNFYIVPEETLYLEFINGELRVKGQGILAGQNRLLNTYYQTRENLMDWSNPVAMEASNANVLSWLTKQASPDVLTNDFKEFIALESKYYGISKFLDLDPKVSAVYREFSATELAMLEQVMTDQHSEQALNSESYRNVLKAYLEYLRVADPKQRLKASKDSFLENEIWLASYFDEGLVRNYVAGMGLNDIMVLEGKNESYPSMIETYTGPFYPHLNTRHQLYLSRTQQNFEVETVGHPEIEAVYPNGDPFSLNDYKGKWVIIDFWATWCGPCRRETPYVKRLKSMLDKSKVEVIYVSLDAPKDADKWKQLLVSEKMTGIQVMAKDEKRVRKDLSIGMIPRFIILDPQGAIYASIRKISTGTAHPLIMGLGTTAE